MNELQLAALLDQAHTLIQEEKPLHAIQVYLRLIRKEPSCIRAYIELSSFYAERGMYEAATDLVASVSLRYPEHAELTFHLGSLRMRAEQYDEALTCFKKLSSYRLPHVHFNMGVAYFCKNNIKLAEEQFRLTLKYDPGFPKVQQSLGELLLKRNAFAEAIKYLKKSIIADPYSSVSHHLLGIAYGKVYDWKKAYDEFVVAIEMDPHNFSNWHLCGEALMQLKRFDESERYMRKALELNPDSIDVFVAFAQLFLKRGDMPKAKEYAEKVLAIDPKSPGAKEIAWKLRGKAVR